MQAALLSDRGVVKVSGDPRAAFCMGSSPATWRRLRPASARFAALLTPQGKIIADFIVDGSAQPRTAAAFSSTAREPWPRR